MRTCEYCGTKADSEICPGCGARMPYAEEAPSKSEHSNVQANVRPSYHNVYDKEKFYQKSWFIILMLIFVWPVGLVMMWVQKKFPLAVRIIVTIVILLIAIGSIV